MTSKLRVGLIGAGRMGNVHTGILKAEGLAHVVAACDLIPEKAQAKAEEWGGRAYTDHQTMLAQEDLDAVYICTPTFNHGVLALDCVDAGLPIFVEKPLELDLGVAGRLVKAAQAKDVLVCVAFHWRYSPGYLQAQKLMGDDPITMVGMSWYWTRPPIPWMWDRHKAGGQIVDQNIHLIDASQGLAGEIESVYAAYNSRQVNFEPGFDNWDGYALTLRYKNGAVGTCAGTYGLFPQIQVGPIADFALRDRMVRLTNKGVSHFTPNGVEEWPNGDDPFHAGVNRAFIAAVAGGDRALITATLQDGLRSTAVTLAANHSAETGEVVALDRFIRERTGIG